MSMHYNGINNHFIITFCKRLLKWKGLLLVKFPALSVLHLTCDKKNPAFRRDSIF